MEALRKLALRLPLVVLTLLVCAPGGTEAAPKDQVVIIQGPEPETLDTSMERGMVTFNVSKHVLETLTHLDAEQNLRPMLAVSWRALTPTAWEFKLHPGARFHDGTPVTAGDVAFTFRRIMDPKLKSEQRRYLKDTFKQVEVVDPKTVRLHLKHPYAPLLNRLALIGIVPRHYVEKVGERGFGQRPLGAGPYRFVRWLKGQRIELEAFPDYFRGAARVKRVVFKFVREDATRVAALLSGEADIIMNLPTSYYASVQKNPNTFVASAPSLRGFFLMMNSRPGKVLSDVRVRRAIGHALNREALVKHLLEGRGGLLNSVLTPKVFGYNPNLKGFPHDPEKAKKLLAEAGYPGGKGLKLRMFAAAGRYLNDREMVQAIAGDLRRVGIAVEVKTMPFAGFRKYYMKYQQELDISFFSNANNSADANYNLQLNFYSKGRGIYWNHPEVDRLIEEAAAESDRERRRQLYLKAQQIIVDREAAFIPLYHQDDLYGVSKRIRFRARPDESVYVYDDLEPAL